MTVTVRAARPADYPRAGELCVEAYRADGQLADSGVVYAIALADVAARVTDATVLVAVDEADQLLGCVTFTLPGTRWAELRQPDSPEFRMLAVATKAQGQGVGAALVSACLALAVDLGYQSMAICVRDFNTPAKRLYARAGFRRAPELDWSPAPDINLEGLRIDLRQFSKSSSATASPAS